MVLVEIFGLQIEASSGLPIVLLREVADPHRVLPIFIGGPEALAIARGLQGISSDRPLTHDLLVDLLERTGNHLEEVAVTELRDGTFFAELRLGSDGGRRVLSSRPSDAIALAVRVGAPVYASEDVLAEAGAVLRQADDNEEDEEKPSGAAEVAEAADPVVIDEMIEEFRGFLDELNPSDFLAREQPGPPPAGGAPTERADEPHLETAEPAAPPGEPDGPDDGPRADDVEADGDEDHPPEA
jgi:bifunctional DNase/RNase